MKAHEFISRLEEAKYGRRRVREDKGAVADSPSHAPTSTAQWKTPSSGKSEDEGERTGGEKDAIKQSKHSIPAPVAKAPSHAPTSGKDATTTGKGSSEDQGEKVSKEAMKEGLLRRLIDADEDMDITAIMAEAELAEGGHKAGCACGFCKNKGSFGKKKEEKSEEGDDDDKDDDMSESALPPRRPAGRAGFGAPAKPGAAIPGKIGQPRRVGGGMGFRHPSATAPRPRAKAAMAAYQPSMERLETSKNAARTIEEMADELLEAPGTE